MKLRFPVLCIAEKSVEVAEDFKHLTTTTTAEIKQGKFEALKIVDSDGWAYDVSGVKIVKGLGPFFGYNLRLQRTVKIDFAQVSEKHRMTFDAIKQAVKQNMKIWCGGMTKDAYSSFKKSINETASIEDLRKVIGPQA